MQISQELSARIYAMWDGLTLYQPKDTREALSFLMESLCSIFDADDACWTAAVRQKEPANDPRLGWRPRQMQVLRRGGRIERAFAAGMKRAKTQPLDVTTIRHAEQSGTFRVKRLCDLAPESWRESEFYRTIYQAHGLHDAIFCCTPVNEDSESYVLLTRGEARGRFSESDVEALGHALRGVRWLSRRALMNHGLLGPSSKLTACERDVLDELLTGKTEKEIAQSLARSVHTTREHIANIYRKFAVSNRPALMAYCLGPAG